MRKDYVVAVSGMPSDLGEVNTAFQHGGRLKKVKPAFKNSYLKCKLGVNLNVAESAS